MDIKEAIEVLKKVKHWIDYGAGELEPTANTVMEAIDTVLSLINTGNKKGLDDSLQEKSIEVSDSQASLSNKKDRLYTDKDMEAFAEWCYINAEWCKGNEWMLFANDGSGFKVTTTQVRERWEVETGRKEVTE